MAELLWLARCCRAWPVMGLTRMGSCGYCRQVPQVEGLWPEGKTMAGVDHGG